MHRFAFIGALILLSLASGSAAQQQQPPQQAPPGLGEGPRLIVTYVEVAPANANQAATLLKAYRDAARKETGHASIDVLQRIGMPGHFVVTEEWHDEASYKAHRANAAATQIRDKIASLRVGPYDERMHGGMTRQPAKAWTAGGITVVTHVDSVPAAVPKAREVLQATAAASRKETGNLRYDVLQGVRMNHFTIVEGWQDERSYHDHIAAAHTKTLKETLQQLSPDAALYDERLFRSVQ